MAFWQENVSQIISSNGFPLLEGSGSISSREMEQKTSDLYMKFDQSRRQQESLKADQQDEAELEALEVRLKSRGKK